LFFPKEAEREVLVNDNVTERRKVMDGTLFTSGEVAAELGIPRWRFLYRIEKGNLPGPTYAVPGRRLFTTDDVELIRAALKKEVEAK
jgi:hypothetical protein